jgi:serine/threonine protein kinase
MSQDHKVKQAAVRARDEQDEETRRRRAEDEATATPSLEQTVAQLTPKQREVSAVLGLPYSDILDLEQFELERRLGHGTFSDVFLAHDSEGEAVALKEYRLAIGVTSADEYDQRRTAFQREVRLLKSVGEHRQIPTFLGVGARKTREGKFKEFQPAIVMEYVDGDTIQERLTSGRNFTPGEIRDMLEQVLDPLDTIHHGNSVPRFHRDIKPANLKLNEEGTLYLLDFGSVRDEIIETMGGTGAIGVAEYKHPEDLLSGQPSFRSELYSVGHVLYAAAIGRGLKRREKFSAEKLAGTNLDSQTREVIELLCDRDLSRGPQDVTQLREYLTVAEPIEVRSDQQDNDRIGTLLTTVLGTREEREEASRRGFQGGRTRMEEMLDARDRFSPGDAGEVSLLRDSQVSLLSRPKIFELYNEVVENREKVRTRGKQHARMKGTVSDEIWRADGGGIDIARTELDRSVERLSSQLVRFPGLDLLYKEIDQLDSEIYNAVELRERKFRLHTTIAKGVGLAGVIAGATIYGNPDTALIADLIAGGFGGFAGYLLGFAPAFGKYARALHKIIDPINQRKEMEAELKIFLEMPEEALLNNTPFPYDADRHHEYLCSVIERNIDKPRKIRKGVELVNKSWGPTSLALAVKNESSKTRVTIATSRSDPRLDKENFKAGDMFREKLRLKYRFNTTEFGGSSKEEEYILETRQDFDNLTDGYRQSETGLDRDVFYGFKDLLRTIREQVPEVYHAYRLGLPDGNDNVGSLLERNLFPKQVGEVVEGTTELAPPQNTIADMIEDVVGPENPAVLEARERRERIAGHIAEVVEDTGLKNPIANVVVPTRDQVYDAYAISTGSGVELVAFNAIKHQDMTDEEISAEREKLSRTAEEDFTRFTELVNAHLELRPMYQKIHDLEARNSSQSENNTLEKVLTAISIGITSGPIAIGLSTDDMTIAYLAGGSAAACLLGTGFFGYRSIKKSLGNSRKEKLHSDLEAELDTARREFNFNLRHVIPEGAKFGKQYDGEVAKEFLSGLLGENALASIIEPSNKRDGYFELATRGKFRDAVSIEKEGIFFTSHTRKGTSKPIRNRQDLVNLTPRIDLPFAEMKERSPDIYQALYQMLPEVEYLDNVFAATEHLSTGYYQKKVHRKGDPLDRTNIQLSANIALRDILDVSPMMRFWSGAEYTAEDLRSTLDKRGVYITLDAITDVELPTGRLELPEGRLWTRQKGFIIRKYEHEDQTFYRVEDVNIKDGEGK